MRDPNRIYRFQGQITRLWAAYPDLRYMQIVALIETKIKEMTPQVHYSDLDLFYVEDGVVELAVNSLIDEAG